MNNTQVGMNQTFVALDKAYAAKSGGGTIAGLSEAHLLDAGAIALFDQDNNLIASTDVAADLLAVTGFYIYQGGATLSQNPRKSVLIPRDAFRWSSDAYRAPVAQISKFGKIATAGTAGFPATPLNGMTATCVITDTTSGQILPSRTIRIEVPIYSTDTAALLGARLRDAINADARASELVTVTYTTGASDDYYTFTGTSGNVNFTVGFDDDIATISTYAFDTQSQKTAFPGVGTNAQVVKSLFESSLSEGREFSRDFKGVPNAPGYWDVNELVTDASGLTFNFVTIQWDSVARASIALNHIATPTILLAEVVSGTGNAVINSRLAILKDYADSTSLPSEGSSVASGFTYT